MKLQHHGYRKQPKRVLQIKIYHKKDLRIGDMITKIDDSDISGLSLQEVFKMLRGNTVRMLVFLIYLSKPLVYSDFSCVLRTLVSKLSPYERKRRWGIEQFYILLASSYSNFPSTQPRILFVLGLTAQKSRAGTARG